MRSTTLAAMIALVAVACSHQKKSASDEDGPAKKEPTKQPDQSMDDVVIKRTHVAGAVHMLEGRGGNIGVSAGQDGTLIIDDQFAPLAPKIRAAVDEIGSGTLKFVINTHWHGDHTGGNPVFGKNANIIAHTNVRKRLSTTATVRGRVNQALPKEGLPVITFRDSISLHFNGEEVRIVHFPTGHTDGDSIIFFDGSNVVHMGDHFFNGRFPFVDLETGGNALQLEKNVAKVLELAPADAKIIPGHGPLGDVEALRAYHQMLVETIGAIRAQKDAGKKPGEITLDPKWKSWGVGFINTDKWIATVYESL